MGSRLRSISNINTDPELIHRWNHSHSILSIVSIPKKRILLAGTQDSKILVIDLPTYSIMKTITLGDSTEINTRSSVLCLTRSEDEKHFFTAGADSLVRVWSVDEVVKSGSNSIKELATIYTVTDIGDIFSIAYIDRLETLIFGCQNASMLYLDNIFQRIEESNKNTLHNMERLPNRRYNKFFDSAGPAGKKKNLNTKSQLSEEHIASKEIPSCILEVPSKNIISYAHHSFIYSITKSSKIHGNNVSGDNEDEGSLVASGGGDGSTKLWYFERKIDGGVGWGVISELDNEETVLCQEINYPFLYCGLSDGLVKIWDLNLSQLVTTLATPEKLDITSIAVYHDHIFASSEAGTTHFHDNHYDSWSTRQGQILSSEIFERTQETFAKPVSFLTGGNDGSLALWDLSPVSDHQTRRKFAKTERQSTNDELTMNIIAHTASIENEVMLETMKEMISFQTVSRSNDPSQSLDLRRCANFLYQLFVDLGASFSQLLPMDNGGPPVVAACFDGNANKQDRKRILWYGHYDVISSGDPELWNSEPFSLTCENGYMKGRGVTDNKGPLIAAIYSAATLFQHNNLANDVVFLIEGLEEIGSVGLEEICIRHKDLIGPKFDWILLSNSSWVDRDNPCLNYGLRGVINAEVCVTNSGPDRHSGVGGGTYREPFSDLIQIISKLQDENGKVMIPHFNSSLNELLPKEIAMFKKVLKYSDIDKKLTLEHLTANWAKPSLSVTNVRTSGPGNITVIPHCASIGLSIRLVPEQSAIEVERTLVKYINDCFENLKSPNSLHVNVLDKANAWLGDPENHAYQVLRQEVTKAWNKEPLFVREGGSVPCIRTLEQIFDAPAIQIPCGQSTDNAHLSNENLKIENWSKLAGILYSVFNKL